MRHKEIMPTSKSQELSPAQKTQELSTAQKPKSTWPRLTALRAQVEEYCQSSSLHGMQYIGDNKRSRTERLFWVFFFILSIVSCAWLVQRMYIKWDTASGIVSFADQETPIWQIPFPAVTICPGKKYTDNGFNMTKAFEEFDNLSPEEQHQAEGIQLTCNVPNQGYVDRFGEEVLDIIYEHGIGYIDQILVATRNTKLEAAESIFHPVLTEEGVCFTFNMMSHKELFTDVVKDDGRFLQSGKTSTWDPDHGYAADAPTQTYPHRALGTGYSAGIYLGIDAFTNNDNTEWCENRGLANKIIIHSPAEIPQVRSNFIFLPKQGSMVITVKPLMTSTSESLAKLPPHKRNCLYSDERQLKFHKIYTQGNCQLECAREYIWEKCGCVEFYMPRTNGTPICSIEDHFRILDARAELVSREVDSKLNGSRGGCDCLPSCNSLNFEIESSHSITRDPVGIVNIIFKDAQFLALKRSAMYGAEDFIANCGGLLGLFMGFSLLSAVELIYFCSLRIFCKAFK